MEISISYFICTYSLTLAVYDDAIRPRVFTFTVMAKRCHKYGTRLVEYSISFSFNTSVQPRATGCYLYGSGQAVLQL